VWRAAFLLITVSKRLGTLDLPPLPLLDPVNVNINRRLFGALVYLGEAVANFGRVWVEMDPFVRWRGRLICATTF